MVLKVVKPTPAAEAPDPPPPSPMDRPAQRRRFKPATIALAVVILAAGGAGAFAYVKFGLTRSASVDVARLTVSEVHRGLFKDFVPATGTVAPIDTIYLDTPEGGQVQNLLVEEGAMVRAGQPILKLANTRLELEVIGREAQFDQQRNALAALQQSLAATTRENRRAVEDADYQIERVSADLARYGPLAERGFYPKATIEDLQRQLAYNKGLRATRLEAEAADKARMDQQLAEVRAASRRLDESVGLVRQSLTNLTVTAPIDGQLTVLSAKPGQAIPPGQRIGQVDRVDGFKTTVQIDEFYLGRVAAGQGANVEIGGRTYPLTVAKVYPDVRERRFQADLAFQVAAPTNLRTGQTLQLRIELGQQPNSLIVANGAFYEDTGGAWVFVVSPDGNRAERRAVRLGRRNPETVEVLSGLQPGERIITSSYSSWRDIDRINLVGAAPAAKKGASS